MPRLLLEGVAKKAVDDITAKVDEFQVHGFWWC